MGEVLYADGGVKGLNPSSLGGVFAWVRVRDDAIVAAGHVGHVYPADIRTTHVTNNNTELLALLDGLAALPRGWRGTVASDSEIALHWVFGDWRRKKIPPFLCRALEYVERKREEGVLDYTIEDWQLLGGHPTPGELATGIREARYDKTGRMTKPRLPCSRWNEVCDTWCRQRVERWDTPAYQTSGWTANHLKARIAGCGISLPGELPAALSHELPEVAPLRTQAPARFDLFDELPPIVSQT